MKLILVNCYFFPAESTSRMLTSLAQSLALNDW